MLMNQAGEQVANFRRFGLKPVDIDITSVFLLFVGRYGLRLGLHTRIAYERHTNRTAS